MTDLTVRDNLTALVLNRDQIFKECLGMMCQTCNLENKIVAATGLGLPREYFTLAAVTSYRDTDDLRSRLDHTFWWRAFELANLNVMMSSSGKDDFYRQLVGDVPPFDVNTVHAVLMPYVERGGDLLLDGLHELWSALRSRFRNQKSFGFGHKIVIEGMIDYQYRYIQIVHRELLYDLDRIASLLKGENISRNWDECKLHTLLTLAMDRKDAQDGSFKLKVFNNGNLHIQMNEDLVDLLNQALAKVMKERSAT